MAAITHTLASLASTRSNQGVAVASWGPTTLDADTFSAIECASSTGRSVQVTGTFNGATITMTGSNDGTNYVALKDQAGNSVAFTAAGFKSIFDAARYIKPALSSAGASTSLTATVLVRV
jgi:hypothetical protein